MEYNWKSVKDYQDIIYEKWEGIAKITINRPDVRNAFRPETVIEMHEAFDDAHEDPDVGVILLTGKNPSYIHHCIMTNRCMSPFIGPSEVCISTRYR